MLLIGAAATNWLFLVFTCIGDSCGNLKIQKINEDQCTGFHEKPGKSVSLELKQTQKPYLKKGFCGALFTGFWGNTGETFWNTIFLKIRDR